MVLWRQYLRVERQRPRLRWARSGFVIGVALTVLGILGVGSPVLGAVIGLASLGWGGYLITRH